MTNPALEVIAKIDLLIALIQSNRGAVQVASGDEKALNDAVAALAESRARLMTSTMSWSRDVHNAATMFQVHAGMVSKALGKQYVAPLLAMNPIADEVPPTSSSSIGPEIVFNARRAFLPLDDPRLNQPEPEMLPVTKLAAALAFPSRQSRP